MLENTNIKSIINQELDELNQIKSKLEEALIDAPRGSLNISSSTSDKAVYYLYCNGERKYINDINKAGQLAQNSYYGKVLKLINRRIALLRSLKRELKKSIFKVYDSMVDARKNLVSPIVLSDDDYIQMWIDSHPGNQNIEYPIENGFVTNKGETVRSKSEKILADLFHSYGLIYVYEPRLTLPNGTHIYPDFLILNLRTRETYVYEHFGKMDEKKYASNTCRKLISYKTIGFTPWKNLLFSMETANVQIDIEMVKLMIKTCLI